MQFLKAVTLGTALLALTACDATIPVKEGAISPEARAAGYPQLAPLTPLIAGAGHESTAEPAGSSLSARAAALRRRAAALRGRDVFEGQDALRNL